MNNPYLPGSREEYIMENINLAYSRAVKYQGFGKKYKFELEDLRNIAVIGLIKAYERYNPVKFEGVKFSTYAVTLIDGEIKNNINHSNFGIKLCRQSKELGRKIRTENLEDSDFSEITKQYNCDEKIAKEALFFSKGYEQCVSSEKLMLSELCDSKKSELGTNESLIDLFNCFDEREKIVFEKVFLQGFLQSDVAKLLNVHQATISRIITRIRERIEVYIKYGYTNKKFNPPNITKRRVKK